MARIFVSYRHADNAAGYAMDLARILRETFGERHVFRDTRSIPPGVDFGAFIRQMLESCTVMLVVIGRHWASEQTEDGRPRLFEPNDWVRLEVATALAAPHVRVIPVLVGGATLPRTDQLPADLQPLLSRTAVLLEDKKWESDVASLIADLEEVPGLRPWWQRLRRRPARRSPRPSGVRRKAALMVAAGVAGLTLLGAALAVIESELDGLAPIDFSRQTRLQPIADDSAVLGRSDVRPVGQRGQRVADLTGTWRDGNGNRYQLRQVQDRIVIAPISGAYAGIGGGIGQFDGRDLQFGFVVDGQVRWTGTARLTPDNRTLLGEVRDRFTGFSEELYLSRL